MAKRMAEQMELFEPVERGFEEGGLMDEGGTVDPVSGNDVPPGSTQEEVRDDIPAQLSEGEFVFPADVVRYIGLENLMRMRQEAKMGLAQMEEMGQMGNSEEATMPDNLPFDMYDLDIDDEGEYNSETRNYQVGGYVAPTVPINPYSQPGQVDPQTGTYTLPGTGIAGYQVPSGTPTGYTPYGGAQPYFQPVQFTGAQYQTALQTTNLPTFAETVGGKPGQYDELRTYINDAGQTLQIPFKDGKPIYPIPEGYRPIGDEPAPEEEQTTVTPTLGETQVMEDDRGGDGPGNADVSSGTGMPGYNNPTTRRGLSMLSKEYAAVTNPFSMSKANLAALVIGAINPVLGLVTRGIIDNATYNSELARLAEDYSFFGSPEDVASLATTMARTAEDYSIAQSAYSKAQAENDIGGMANAQDAMSRAKAELARDATRTAGRAQDVDTDEQGIVGLEGFTEDGKGVSPGPGAPTRGGPGKGRDGSAARSPDTEPGHPGMSDVQSDSGKSDSSSSGFDGGANEAGPENGSNDNGGFDGGANEGGPDNGGSSSGGGHGGMGGGAPGSSGGYGGGFR